MSKVIGPLILVAFMLSGLATEIIRWHSNAETRTSDAEVTNVRDAIKVTITTVGPMLGPPTNVYHVGEQIPVTINMTNVSGQSASVCISGDMYQDLPTLTTSGHVVPYAQWQSYLVDVARKEKTCVREDLPETVELKPNESVLADSLIVIDDAQAPTGAIAWYPGLGPGTYSLSIKRRFDCCDGPMVQSNTISFEVIP